jgi:large subunit ribosomal protein L31e
MENQKNKSLGEGYWMEKEKKEEEKAEEEQEEPTKAAEEEAEETSEESGEEQVSGEEEVEEEKEEEISEKASEEETIEEKEVEEAPAEEKAVEEAAEGEEVQAPVEGEEEAKPPRKKEEEEEIVEEKVYTIPLGKTWILPSNKRASRAVRMIRAFVTKNMKLEQRKGEETEEEEPKKLVISNEVNEKVWRRGMQKPPRNIRVRAAKDKDGNVTVYLAEGD